MRFRMKTRWPKLEMPSLGDCETSVDHKPIIRNQGAKLKGRKHGQIVLVNVANTAWHTESLPLQLFVGHIRQYFSINVILCNNLLVLIDLAP